MEKQDYYSIPRKSNSLLNRVEYFYRKGIIDKFTMEDESTKSMEFGSHVHKVFEQDNLTGFTFCDPSFTANLSANELKVVQAEEGARLTEYLSLYNNADTRSALQGEAKAIAKCRDIVKSIETKGAAYISFYKNNKTSVILNEADYRTIEGLIIAWKQHDLYTWLMNAPIIYREHELYWEDKKGKADLIAVFPDRYVLVDYKTFDNDIESNIVKYNITRQFSFYNDGIRNTLYKEHGEKPIHNLVIGLNKRSLSIEPVWLADYSIKAVEYNFFYRPYFFDKYDDNEQFNPVCDVYQLDTLEQIGALRRGYRSNPKTWNVNYRMGWLQLCKIVDKYNLLDKPIDTTPLDIETQIPNWL